MRNMFGFCVVLLSIVGVLAGCPPAKPTVTSFVVDDDDSLTLSFSVTLSSTCTGNPQQYMASESSTFAGTSWQPYSSASSFTLSSSPGLKRVYFKVKGASGESAAVSDAIKLREETVLLPGNVPLDMMWCPEGTFLMGRRTDEQGSHVSEDPRHQVTLSYSFWMGKYELTKRQWTAVMGTTPWAGQDYVLSDPDSPATHVSWYDAKTFVAALNAHSGLTFRLPSEAEWEYACRAGTTGRFYWGDDPSYSIIGDYAWYAGNCSTEQYGHVVGLKLPNGFGLYDMSGNVMEWCEDDWEQDYVGAPTNGTARIGSPRDLGRTYRSGCWGTDGESCRAALRDGDHPASVSPAIGIRVAR